MRQLLLEKGNLVVRQVAQPLLHDKAILVSVQYAYITQYTDVGNLKNKERFLGNVPHKVKRVLEAVASQSSALDRQMITNSYACAGQVISVGKKVTKFAPGDFVACVDPACSPHADLVCVSEQHAVKVFKKELLNQASLVPLAAHALHAMRRSRVQIGEQIAIFGLNITGFLALQLAKISGASVIVVDTDQSRLDLAKELGADFIFNASHDDVAKEVRLLTEGHGVDASFLFHNNEQLFDQSVTVTRNKGRLTLLDNGVFALKQSEKMQNLDIIVARDFSEDQGQNVDAYCPMRWTDSRNMRACLDLLERGAISFDRFINEQVTIDKLDAAYDRVQKNLSLGVMLSYAEHHSQAASFGAIQDGTSDLRAKFVPARADKVAVGILGVDDFMDRSLMPALSKIRTISIKGVVDPNFQKKTDFSKNWQLNDSQPSINILGSSEFDVVIISSAQASNIDLVLDLLKRGKGVFLERPMVTDLGQLQRYQAFFEKNAAVPFGVNYSYAFSPLVQKIKKMVQKRRTPLMVQYRVNRQPRKLDHHNLADSGAGTIISDACQIVDLFCHLTDAQPISVSVESMHSARDDIFPTDNFNTQISFNDGSVCSLVQTTLGHPDMGSERLEIFYDNSAILMEEFMELYGFGLSSRFNETITTPDTGLNNLLSLYFNGIEKNSYQAPIAWDRLYTVAQTTLLIDQLACQAGGKKDL